MNMERTMTEENAFSKLEQSILKSKGLTDEQLVQLSDAGIGCKDDFKVVGDVQTLVDVSGLDIETAQRVIAWATGAVASGAAGADANQGAQTIMVDSADVVYCAHCKSKQPKDYKSGDLCFSCGLQVEPTLTCHWCSSASPGKFCRSCGSQMLATADFELGLLLKRDGVAKDEIVPKLNAASAGEKEALWSRVRAHANR
jgi:hypothetical protein